MSVHLDMRQSCFSPSLHTHEWIKNISKSINPSSQYTYVHHIFISSTRLILWNMYVYSYTNVRILYICVTGLIDTGDMTHSYAWRDSSVWVRDSFMCHDVWYCEICTYTLILTYVSSRCENIGFWDISRILIMYSFITHSFITATLTMKIREISNTQRLRI